MTTHAQVSMREVLSDAIRFWEPRRIVYNLALAAVVLVFAAASWMRIRDRISFELLLALLVLAVLANVCYCAAYLVDVPLQFSEHRTFWRHWRWLLWLFGVLFAVALAWYWTGDEILPALIAGK